ncbi:MAG: helix-turn-helix domain-containing protein [Alcanivorax sp.]|nr:helix-turn-helix domain-containing protein [Alcanivorax sp.]
MSANPEAAPADTELLSPLFLWNGGWLMIMRRLHNRPHRHVAASLLVGLEGPITVTVDGQCRRQRQVLVAPECEQSLASDGPVAVLHLDPDESAWRVRANTPLPDDLPAQLAALTAAPSADTASALIRQLRDGRVAPLDARIAATCRQLKRAPELADSATLAAAAGLSESRFRHLFREQLGVTLKRYLLHLKCQRVVALWRDGMTFTELAQHAGFYDQPHLNRTLRAMFDALPSRYARHLPVPVLHLSLP